MDRKSGHKQYFFKTATPPSSLWGGPYMVEFFPHQKWLWKSIREQVPFKTHSYNSVGVSSTQGFPRKCLKEGGGSFPPRVLWGRGWGQPHSPLDWANFLHKSINFVLNSFCTQCAKIIRELLIIVSFLFFERLLKDKTVGYIKRHTRSKF